MASITKITTVCKNGAIMGRTSKKDNADAFRNQPFLPLASVDTPKLYKIKKTV